MAVLVAPTNPRPEAKVFKVEDLLQHARDGRLRVPPFQRGFQWDRGDVEKLFDSIWRGYPIGTLLLWTRPGPAGLVALGELTFEVREQVQSWFVVDGQQRIVSLVSTLLPRSQRAPIFDLYFDLVASKVAHASRGGPSPGMLPLSLVVDAEDLHAWIDANRMALTTDQVKLAFRVGKLIREYEIPAYVIDTRDEVVVREIFERVNTTTKAMAAADVFNALHAPLDRQPSARLTDIVERLRVRSLGDLEEDHVLRALLAIENRDASGELRRQLADVDVAAAVSRVERALDRVLGFLAQDGGIPHLRLLPYKSPLTVLAVFFDRFPTPSERARRLLTRWLWRGFANEELRGEGRGVRPALAAIAAGGGPEEAAVGVLKTVSQQAPPAFHAERFNLRHAQSRLVAIALVELRPLELTTATPLDTGKLLSSDDDVFPQIVPRPTRPSATLAALLSSAGNRLLHPAIAGTSMLAALRGLGPGPVARSHGISPEALARIGADDREGFLSLRDRDLAAAALAMIERRAEWAYPDRLSIESLSDAEE